MRRCLVRAIHVPERLCGGIVYLGRYNKCSHRSIPFFSFQHFENDANTSRRLYPRHLKFGEETLPPISVARVTYINILDGKDHKPCLFFFS